MSRFILAAVLTLSLAATLAPAGRAAMLEGRDGTRTLAGIGLKVRRGRLVG